MLFSNERRIIAQDLNHIQEKKRYFCFGKANNESKIFGAGYWRKGEKIYEQRINIQISHLEI